MRNPPCTSRFDQIRIEPIPFSLGAKIKKRLGKLCVKFGRSHCSANHESIPINFQGQDCPKTSEKFTDHVRIYRDLNYCGNGNKRQMLDLYLPSKRSSAHVPLIIYVHGGGYVEGDKENPQILYAMLENGEYAGASINYRLAAEALLPAQIDDLETAICWLGRHSDQCGIDVGRTALLGISAGGQIASMVGVSGFARKPEPGSIPDIGQHNKISCVINYAGFSDFVNFTQQGSKVIDLYNVTDNVCQALGGP